MEKCQVRTHVKYMLDTAKRLTLKCPCFISSSCYNGKESTLVVIAKGKNCFCLYMEYKQNTISEILQGCPKVTCKTPTSRIQHYTSSSQNYSCPF